MEFKDLFSRQSSDYARYRPGYPDGLFDALAERAPGRRLAWDCGTGSGQAACALARRFDTVIATDPSRGQLASAAGCPGVAYAIGGAERAPLGAACCDLVTAAQAFHWFDQSAFYRECRRVLRPGGLVAIWCYDVFRVTPAVDAVVHELYEGILGPYWEPERRQVEEGYARAEFPFEPVPMPALEMRSRWDLERALGYFATWSALQTYLKRNPGAENPLVSFAPRLAEAWGGQRERDMYWGLRIRVGRV
jgi:SAM-dependent methyltransferase